MNKDSAEMADRNLKNHDKRLEAQNKDRSSWYKHYQVRTAQLEREYEFVREKKWKWILYLIISNNQIFKIYRHSICKIKMQIFPMFNQRKVKIKNDG